MEDNDDVESKNEADSGLGSSLEDDRSSVASKLEPALAAEGEDSLAVLDAVIREENWTLLPEQWTALKVQWHYRALKPHTRIFIISAAPFSPPLPEPPPPLPYAAVVFPSTQAP